MHKPEGKDATPKHLEEDTPLDGVVDEITLKVSPLKYLLHSGHNHKDVPNQCNSGGNGVCLPRGWG